MEEKRESQRSKRVAPAVPVIAFAAGAGVGAILSMTVISLKNQSRQMGLSEKSNAKDLPLYKGCNDSGGLFKHIVTAGFCSGATITANVIDVVTTANSFGSALKSIDLNGIANVIGFIIFVSGASSFAANLAKYLGETTKAAAIEGITILVDYLGCGSLKELNKEGGIAIDVVCSILIVCGWKHCF